MPFARCAIPSISISLASLAGAQPSSRAAVELETVARLSATPGNIAVTPEGRIIVSQHPFSGASTHVVEVLPDGSTRPFPTVEWAGSRSAEGVGFTAVIGVKCDSGGVVWMLDMGSLNRESAHPPRLVGWDTRTDRQAGIVMIAPPAATAASFLQDMAVDAARGRAFIADCGISKGYDAATPAVVVVNLATGGARRRLENHPSVRPEAARIVIDGRPLTDSAGGKTSEPRVGINPIALDAEGRWLYYGSMNGTTVWRVPADALMDDKATDEQIAARIERFGRKAASDGFAFDAAGNLYITDVNENAIGVTDAAGNYRVLLRDAERLSWPDALHAGPGGWMYAVNAQLHRHPRFNSGTSSARPPFYITRFKTPADR